MNKQFNMTFLKNPVLLDKFVLTSNCAIHIMILNKYIKNTYGIPNK